MATNSIRFTGLASGLDTDSMVKALMTTQQNKIDKQTGQKTLLDWKKDAWKEMNTKINTFYTKYVDKLRYAGTFNKTAATVSNENAIKLDKNTVVPEGNHTVEIKEMATGVTVNTKTIGSSATKDTTLVTLGISADTSIGISLNADGSAAKEIVLKPNMTVAGLEAELKNKFGTDYNVSFDTGVKGFVISSKTTGENKAVTIGGFNAGTIDTSDITAKAAFEKIGIGYDSGGVFKSNYTGSNAEVIYNGGVTIESSTNNIEVNGIKFAITGKSSEVINISSTKDTEAIVSFVKEFVDAYNTLLDDITTKLSTKKPLDYEPLTDEQKESMTDADIEDWEKKIKDGLFYRDSSLAEVREAMQNILQNSVAGNKYAVLGKIGLASTSWKDQGRITLNEEKLKAAVNEDADAVIELFIGNDTTEGIGTKLNKSFKTMSESIKDVKTYNSYYNDVVDTEKTKAVSERITALQEKYETMEKMYYNKFTAMEKMMSQLNNQSNWLTNALA